MRSELLNLLSPEENLLISLCRLDFTEEQKQELKDLVKTVSNWDYFFFLANGHGVIALCSYNLSNIGCSEYVPGKYLEFLQTAFLKSMTRNIFLKNLLVEIAGLAGKDNINIIALKGNSLEEMVYGNKGLRQMSDIDILVETDKAIHLRNILLASGFRSLPLISPLHGSILPFLKVHLPAMEKNGAIVEIHTRLFEQKSNSLTEDFFKTATRPYENLPNLYWPDPQKHFLYLIKHLVRHENTKDLKLKSYLDLAVLCNTFGEKIINDRLFEYARLVNLEDEVFGKFRILKLLWNLQFPDIIDKATMVVDQHRIIRHLAGFIKDPFRESRGKGDLNLLRPIRSLPCIKNKVFFIAGYLFPSLTYMKYFYRTESKAQAILFYPVRWWNIIRLSPGKKGLRI
jgi:hypothetical protein